MECNGVAAKKTGAIPEFRCAIAEVIFLHFRPEWSSRYCFPPGKRCFWWRLGLAVQEPQCFGADLFVKCEREACRMKIVVVKSPKLLGGILRMVFGVPKATREEN